jgi:multisubunit Na+/H+ antiporter MnhF subunit
MLVYMQISSIHRLMKRLKISMGVSILHSAISYASVLTLSWRFVFGAEKRDRLLILDLQTTFNVHYFFYVFLELVTNSLPYTAAMMIINIKNTIMSFPFSFSV